jgi:hypothetical protein
MRIAAGAIIVTTGVVGLVGSVLAADMNSCRYQNVSLRPDHLSGDHRGVLNREARPGRDLLGCGWYGALQDADRGHVAR